MKYQIIFKNGSDVVFEAEDCVVEKDFMGETFKIAFKEPKGTRPVWFRLGDITAIILIEDEEKKEESKNDILKREFSDEFIKKMQNAILTSHYKYGWMSKTYPELAQAYKCIKERLELYEKTHNTEYLVDIANFAMIEFKHPAFEDANYTPTDSDKSPGLSGGISYKQMMEEMKDERR